MGRLYLVGDKAEVDRRRRLCDQSALIEVWQDLCAPDIFWIGDDEARRSAYGRKSESPPAGLFWMGEGSKKALDRAGGELRFLLALEEDAVPVYYGPRLTDIESLPGGESLRARVLSAHGIAVAWITYDRFGARTEYQPASPLDPVFYLRRPGGHAAHLWRLFTTKREAVLYMAEYFGRDPESGDWAEGLKAEHFQELLDRYGKKP